MSFTRERSDHLSDIEVHELQRVVPSGKEVSSPIGSNGEFVGNGSADAQRNTFASPIHLPHAYGAVVGARDRPPSIPAQRHGHHGVRVSPKRVELSSAPDLPHLQKPVVACGQRHSSHEKLVIAPRIGEKQDRRHTDVPRMFADS